MKKQRFPILLILTVMFLAFTIGFFIGRNQTKETVFVSVPAHMQTQPPPTTESATLPDETAETVSFPIAVNSATKDEFMALPGIGEVLAERIIAYRDSHGPFAAVEGLMNVEGIGEKRMEEIWDLIVLED
ncbi:MAG: helix-hairpin-helix domain-containing protein [Oscillospiraceae bacterium]|nr:helix-hairpin-helix domain-containing protein [Oscillospiraceae bacterium]